MLKLSILIAIVSAVFIYKNEALISGRPCQKYCYKVGYNNVFSFTCCSYIDKPGLCPPHQCEFKYYNRNICGYRSINCYDDRFCPFGFKCCYDHCLRSKICRRVWEPRSVNQTTLPSPSSDISTTVGPNSTTAISPTTEGTVITTSTETTTVRTTDDTNTSSDSTTTTLETSVPTAAITKLSTIDEASTSIGTTNTEETSVSASTTEASSTIEDGSVDDGEDGESGDGNFEFPPVNDQADFTFT